MNVFTEIAKSRHCIVRGSELDTEKAAAILLDDFRSGKLGESHWNVHSNYKKKFTKREEKIVNVR